MLLPPVSFWELMDVRTVSVVRTIAPQAWAQMQKHDVFGRAAQLAYYFLLSGGPLLLFLTALLGMVAAGEEIRRDMMGWFAQVMPPSAFELVGAMLDEIASGSSGGKLSVGIVVTLWTASTGMVDLILGLNKAYDVTEARSWLRRRLVAMALTVMLAALTVTALALVLYGHQLGTMFARSVGLGAAFAFLWGFTRWGIVTGFVLLAFILVYRYAPNVRTRRWECAIPGAVVAFMLWLASSIGLRIYLSHFNEYNKTYGSLGAVIILMLWLYLFGAALLIGGEVNSAIERTSTRAKASHSE
jgi:membrane protein